MSQVEKLQVVGAAMLLLPAVVWAVAAWRGWRTRDLRPRHPMYRLARLGSGAMALAYVLAATGVLVSPTWGPPTSPDWPVAVIVLYGATQWVTVAALSLQYHATALATGEPRRTALLLNYGAAVLMAVFGVTFRWLVPLLTLERQLHVYLSTYLTYVAVMIALCVRNLVRGRLSSTIRPLAASRTDAALFVGGLAVMAGGIIWYVAAQSNALDATPNLATVSIYIVHWAFAMPMALRHLRDVVRAIVVGGAMLLACGLVLLSAESLGRHVPIGDARLLFGAAVLAVLLVVVVPGQALVRHLVEVVVFRRPRHQRAALQAFLQSLTPELGAGECTRRALDELKRIVGLRGAAVLRGDGDAIVVGDVSIDGLRTSLTAHIDADWLTTGALVANQFRGLDGALRKALMDADIVAVVPIVSPRRRIGHLVVTAGLVRVNLDEEEVTLIEAFCDQLALVLDACELLARTVTIERSLAHAEKLAAIGELTARIVHDIRNPLTAARSLTQQLAGAPAADAAELHAVILEELERMEHQVADLLRFARRDELRLEPIDVAALLRGTAAQFAMRLEAAGIALEVDAPDGVSVHADRERLRQALANLVENAMDALKERADVPRRLALGATATNGAVTLRVSDNGPGAAPDVLPRLFEPFFSQKAHGTGLGLAIVRRTVEAHGGRLWAESRDGMTFFIGLPPART